MSALSPVATQATHEDDDDPLGILPRRRSQLTNGAKAVARARDLEGLDPSFENNSSLRDPCLLIDAILQHSWHVRDQVFSRQVSRLQATHCR